MTRIALSALLLSILAAPASAWIVAPASPLVIIESFKSLPTTRCPDGQVLNEDTDTCMSPSEAEALVEDL